MKFVDLDAQFALIGEDIRYAIDRVLAHKQFILGPEVATLEEQLQDYCGVRHVISAASGTDALLMALMAYEVGPGDAVIAPSFTFVATAEVIQLLGATPVFVDVDATTFNIDPEALAATIDRVHARNDVQLRGIIPVDLFGTPANHARIRELADHHDLFIIADAGQSFGATYREQRVGNFGDMTATSFFPAKPLGCYGDGGAVFTDDPALAEIIESIRFHGKGTSQYDNVRIGVTGRLDTLQAAILSCKMKIFDQELARRQEIADYYTDALQAVVQPPAPPSDCRSSWSVYTIRSPQRDAIRASLQQHKLPSAIYYASPLHRQPAFNHAIGGGCAMAVTDLLATEVLSLPIHPYLTNAELDQIIAVIVKACKRA